MGDEPTPILKKSGPKETDSHLRQWETRQWEAGTTIPSKLPQNFDQASLIKPMIKLKCSMISYQYIYWYKEHQGISVRIQYFFYNI